MPRGEKPGTRIAKHAARLRALRKDKRGARSSERRLADEYRVILRWYEDAVASGEGDTWTAKDLRKLRSLAKEAMLYLGGEADVRSLSLKDYDHERYGPYLGVSDEGSAAAVIRKAALDSPKVRATRSRSPLVVGVAHDAERLAAIGEVPVGPAEYADIRLECTGRILTSTNVGTRVNLRFYKRYPVVTVSPGPAEEALEAAKRELKRTFQPFVETPDGRARPLTVFVEFDRESRRSFRDRMAILKKLVQFVGTRDIADPACHRLGFQMRIGFGTRGQRAAFLAVNLASAARVGEVAIDGVVRKKADELVSLPGLLNYLPPEHLQPVLERARAKGVRIRPKNTVDPDTVARNIWTSLHAARSMGLALGKYGTFPLTLEESDEVIREVQGWFADWSAAPVFFLDQGILSAETVYVGDQLIDGLEAWLETVARHGVPVVLIDTVDKSMGWRILKDRSHPEKGLLTAAEIRSIDRFARKRGIKVLWAGGITLAQTYDFGRMGVFGIYVTSAAASATPVSPDYERDPQLASMKEPTYEGVFRAKLLLEAGFLAERMKGTEAGKEIAGLARSLIGATESSDRSRAGAEEPHLVDRVMAAWKAYLGRR